MLVENLCQLARKRSFHLCRLLTSVTCLVLSRVNLREWIPKHLRWVFHIVLTADLTQFSNATCLTQSQESQELTLELAEAEIVQIYGAAGSPISFSECTDGPHSSERFFGQGGPVSCCVACEHFVRIPESFGWMCWTEAIPEIVHIHSMDRHHFVGIKLLVLSFTAHPFAEMPQLSFIFFSSSKTDNIPMKLFTCLIEINIAQLYLFPCRSLNVWKYADCCGMEQVVFPFFSFTLEFFLYKNSSHSFFGALTATLPQILQNVCKEKVLQAILILLCQKNATVNATTWFLFIYLLFFEASVHWWLREWLWLGLEEKKNNLEMSHWSLRNYVQWWGEHSFLVMRWGASQCHWRCAECCQSVEKQPQRLNFQNVLFACLHTHRKLLNLRSI